MPLRWGSEVLQGHSQSVAGPVVGAGGEHDVIRTEFFRPVKRPFEIVVFWSLPRHFSLQNNVICQNMFTCKSSSSYCTLGPALRRLRHVPIPKLFWLERLELTQAETAL